MGSQNVIFQWSIHTINLIIIAYSFHIYVELCESWTEIENFNSDHETRLKILVMVQ